MSSYKSVFNALQNQFEQFARDGEPDTETAMCQRIDTREQAGRVLLQALNDGLLSGNDDIDKLIRWVGETAPKLATDDIMVALLAWHKFCGVDLFGPPNEAGQCKMILFSRDESIPLARLVPGGIDDPSIIRRYRNAAPGERDVTRLVRAFAGVDRAMNQRFALACTLLAGLLVAESEDEPTTSWPDDSAMVSAKKIAGVTGLATGAVRGRLAVFRKSNFEGWTEQTDRKPRDAQFLYKPSAIKRLFTPHSP